MSGRSELVTTIVQTRNICDLLLTPCCTCFVWRSITGNQIAVVGEASVSKPPVIVQANQGIVAYDQFNSRTEIHDAVKALQGNRSETMFAETWATMVEDGIVGAAELSRLLAKNGTLKQDFAATGGADVSSISRQMEKVSERALKKYTKVTYQKLTYRSAQVSNVVATRSVLKAEVDLFVVNVGGWDVHSNAREATDQNFEDIGVAMDSFVQEMKLQNAWDQVTVVSLSEFGRTLQSNGQGTDHGWGGNAWIAGGAVKGGKVHGQFPSDLRIGGELDVGSGRLIPTTPWEGLWKGVVGWLGVEEGEGEGGGDEMRRIMPNVVNFGSEQLVSKGEMYD